MKMEEEKGCEDSKVARMVEDAQLTEVQRTIFDKFHKYLINSGRPMVTRIEYLRAIARFATFLKGKPFEEFTREDFSDYMFSLRNLKPSTKELRFAIIHSFYTWLGGREGGEEEEKYSKILKKERYRRAKGEHYAIMPEDLPTEEEIRQIIKFAGLPRDKCMIAMAWDLGTRPGELLSLKVSDVLFDEYGATVSIGKSKSRKRTPRLIFSLPYLREWMESHPFKGKPDSPLFIGLGTNQFGKRIGVQTLRWVVKRAAKRAGIERRIYTYLLRHASITREAVNGLSEQQIKTFYGWTPDSRMLKVYSHLTSEDVNKKRLEQAGIVKPKEKVYELNLRKCPRCGAENTPTADYCNKCSSPLDEHKYRELLSKEQELESLKSDIEKLQPLINAMKRIDADPKTKGIVLLKDGDNFKILEGLIGEEAKKKTQ